MKLVNVLTCCAAILAVWADMNDQLGVFMVLKPMTTMLLIAGVVKYGWPNAGHFPRIVFYALIACLVGDILLMWEDLFVFGLGAFLVGHVIFIYAFVSLRGFNANLWTLLVLLLVSIGYYSYLLPNLGELKIPVGVYISVIVIMVWQAINLMLAKKNGVTTALAIAGVLFMFSDSMIALNKFIIPFEWSGAVILISYWLSIGLIANVACSPSLAEASKR